MTFMTVKCAHLKINVQSYHPSGLQDSMKSRGQLALQTATGNWADEEVLEAETPSCSLKLLSSSTCLSLLSNLVKLFQLGISQNDHPV